MPAAVSQMFDESFLRKLERLSVVSKRAAGGHNRGERKMHTGTGIEFADHRDYVPGDDLRRLDWNLYGRLERPLVRMFEDDEDLPLYVLADWSASMGVGAPSKLALALQASAALAYVALANLDRVTVYPIAATLGQGLGPLRGKGQIRAVLDLLGGVEPGGRTDLGAAVAQFVARHRRRGVVVLLSDCYAPGGYEQALDHLRYSRFEAAVVQIVAPEETDPNLRGDVVLVDLETGEEREVTVTPLVRESYRAHYAGRQARLARFCRERAIPCFQVPSTTSFEDLVLRILRAGGVVS